MVWPIWPRDALESSTMKAGSKSPPTTAYAFADPLAAEIDSLRRLGAAGKYDAMASSARAALGRWPESSPLWEALGVAFFQLRRAGEALPALERAAQLDPRRSSIFYALGLSHLAIGAPAAAEQAFRKTLATDPAHIGARLDLGLLLKNQGRQQEAETAWREGLTLAPGNADFANSLGILCRASQRHEEAEQMFRRAIAAQPRSPGFHNNLGLLLAATGRQDEAIESFRHSLALRPRDVPTLNNLATVLLATGDAETARSCCQQALQVDANHAESWCVLSSALKDLDLLDDAENTARRALDLAPERTEPILALAAVLFRKDAFAEQRELLLRVLTLDAGNSFAHYQLAVDDFRTGRLVDAEGRLSRLIARVPDFHEARHALGFLCLMNDDWQRGWDLLDARWLTREALRTRATRPPHCPDWRGETLERKSLLVYAEQGIGDTLQFVRYLSRLPPVGRIVLAVPGSVTRLLEISLGDLSLPVEFVVHAEIARTACDFAVPMMSLPGRLGATIESIPDCPYLRADEREVKERGNLLRAENAAPALRVGFAWKGGNRLKEDRWRSTALASWRPLLARRELRWISLQKGDPGLLEEEIRLLGELGITDRSAEYANFAATAATIANLDLVISVDTAVAHLAGAMGKPVWLLNRATSEWRWGWKKTATRWYPSMRIFNQDTLGDWSPVFDEIGTALWTLTR